MNFICLCITESVGWQLSTRKDTLREKIAAPKKNSRSRAFAKPKTRFSKKSYSAILYKDTTEVESSSGVTEVEFCDRPVAAKSESPVNLCETTSQTPLCGPEKAFYSQRLQYISHLRKTIRAKKLTMLSMERLENNVEAVLDVINRCIPGDIVETGVYKGGSSLLMRGVVKSFEKAGARASWLFDTFEGLPALDKADQVVEKEVGKLRPMDPENSYSFRGGEQSVRAAFAELIGDNFEDIHFVKGYFKDTVASSAVGHIAVLRLDGDMYSSTMQVLEALYPRVSKGGYVIIDDYGHWPQCKKAVHDYFDKRLDMNIGSLLKKVDYTCYYFIKP